MTPAEMIRTARLEAGLTQAALARRLGRAQASVAALERRGANPTVRTLREVLRATGRDLQLRADPLRAEVDEAQIAAHLALTPAERLQAHDAAYRRLRELTSSARRVDGGLG
jgi:transcriptional regulator with XRE-family HTH domain